MQECNLNLKQCDTKFAIIEKHYYVLTYNFLNYIKLIRTFQNMFSLNEVCLGRIVTVLQPLPTHSFSFYILTCKVTAAWHLLTSLK